MSDLSATFYTDFSKSRCSTKLSGGRIHRIRIDANEVTVGTWQDIFGNTVSKTLLNIPITQIASVKYGTSRMLSRQCVLIHLDEMGRQSTLNFTIVDAQSSSNQDDLTKFAAKTLNDLKNGQNSLPSTPFRVSFNPPGLKHKFWYGLFFFVCCFFVWALVQGTSLDKTLFIFLGAIVFFPSLAALVIDYMGNYTQWHPVIQIIVAILAFCLMFIFFVLALGFLEYYGIF